MRYIERTFDIYNLGFYDGYLGTLVGIRTMTLKYRRSYTELPSIIRLAYVHGHGDGLTEYMEETL